jgi:integrase
MPSYYEEGRGWRYDFQLYGHRYRSPRGHRTKKACDKAERALRDRIQDAADGVPNRKPGHGPRFSQWAGVTYDYAVKRRKLSDAETFDRNLRCVLRFFGAKPKDPAKIVEGEPYHDLTLDAPIRDGAWLMRFEAWMERKGLAGSTKNHYRSACSRIYATAMLPEYRTQTGITSNPFRGILRDPPVRRDATFSPDQLRAILAIAPDWLGLAIQIALMAPKLRLGKVLALRWDEHFDRELTWIRIGVHKTPGRDKRPLVTYVTPQLRTLLEAARKKAPKVPWVIHRAGDPLTKRMLQGELARVAREAGVPFGMKEAEGVTFHSLRHTAATELAALGISSALRKDAVGHLTMQMVDHYTHLRPTHEIAPLQLLSESFAGTLAARPNEGGNAGGVSVRNTRKRPSQTARGKRAKKAVKSR